MTAPVHKASPLSTQLGPLAWTLVIPIIALLTLAGAWGGTPGLAATALIFAALMAAVIAAVHHSEVIALRLGEPYGTLVLTVAVTVIEVALTTTTLVAETPATVTVAPAAKPVPVMVITVPPEAGPVVGVALVTVGAASGR